VKSRKRERKEGEEKGEEAEQRKIAGNN